MEEHTVSNCVVEKQKENERKEKQEREAEERKIKKEEEKRFKLQKQQEEQAKRLVSQCADVNPPYDNVVCLNAGKF